MNLNVRETSGTPFVHLSSEKCIFEIRGNSFSERINDIYEKIISWIDKELPSVQCDINFVFYFNVLNSVTYKNVLIIMKKFLELKKQGKNIGITWHYNKDDEDSLELGNDIKELFNLPVSLIEESE